MTEYQYPEWDAIDWSNRFAKISKYFTVGEALLLPSWGIHHIPSLPEKQNIVDLARRMDRVRDLIGASIKVSCWIRPSKTNAPGTSFHEKDYNALVKGAPASAHIIGKAVDWTSGKKNCDSLRMTLLPKLEEFGLRMEQLDGSNWVHCDSKEPINNNRYFKP